jgi:hypothetical protein
LKITKSIVFNLRWHRRIGLSLFFMVIFLSISGFALNHSPDLKLSKVKLTSSWLLSWYGLPPTKQQGYNIADNWLYNRGTDQLFFNDKTVSHCPSPMLAAAATKQLVVALCSGTLVMLTPDGQLIESFNQVQGLPLDSQKVGSDDENIYLITSTDTMLLNTFNLSLSKIENPSKLVINSVAATRVPPGLINEENQEGITLETLILDLHSGRFFGNAGVIFVDIVGLLMCILALTGLWAWVNHQRLRKQKRL